MVRIALATSVAQHARQNRPERISEISVEVRVDDGIQRGVEVADPEEQRLDQRGRDARVADADDEVPAEEGQPAEEEGAHQDAQRAHRLALPAQLVHLTPAVRVLVVDRVGLRPAS